MERFGKFISALMIIGILGGTVWLVMNNRVIEATPTSALVDTSQYPVYDGRDVYEYHRSVLNDRQQKTYDSMKEAFLQFKPEFAIPVDKISYQELREVLNALNLDHAEMFWINGYQASYTVNKNVNVHKYVTLEYTYSKDEAIKVKNDIEPKIQAILSEADNSYFTDKAKVQFVHDKLIEIGTYTSYTDSQKREFQSIVSIFDHGDTVCAGFSYGFKMLMDRLGIDSIAIEYVAKDEADESHIWNMVKIEGTWYNLDITYDNSSVESGGYQYPYYLRDNAMFYMTHEKPENLPNE